MFVDTLHLVTTPVLCVMTVVGEVSMIAMMEVVIQLKQSVTIVQFLFPVEVMNIRFDFTWLLILFVLSASTILLLQ